MAPCLEPAAATTSVERVALCLDRMLNAHLVVRAGRWRLARVWIDTAETGACGHCL